MRRGSEFTLSLTKEAIMERKASAVWRGDLKTGKGSISTGSGVLKETRLLKAEITMDAKLET